MVLPYLFEYIKLFFPLFPLHILYKEGWRHYTLKYYFGGAAHPVGILLNYKNCHPPEMDLRTNETLLLPFGKEGKSLYICMNVYQARQSMKPWLLLYRNYMHRRLRVDTEKPKVSFFSLLSISIALFCADVRSL